MKRSRFGTASFVVTALGLALQAAASAQSAPAGNEAMPGHRVLERQARRSRQQRRSQGAGWFSGDLPACHLAELLCHL